MKQKQTVQSKPPEQNTGKKSQQLKISSGKLLLLYCFIMTAFQSNPINQLYVKCTSRIKRTSKCVSLSAFSTVEATGLKQQTKIRWHAELERLLFCGEALS